MPSAASLMAPSVHQPWCCIPSVELLEHRSSFTTGSIPLGILSCVQNKTEQCTVSPKSERRRDREYLLFYASMWMFQSCHMCLRGFSLELALPLSSAPPWGSVPPSNTASVIQSMLAGSFFSAASSPGFCHQPLSERLS